jgi:predicted Zn-dependent protease with MMP-like domain
VASDLEHRRPSLAAGHGRPASPQSGYPGRVESEPDVFQLALEQALDGLPAEIAARIENVAIGVEEEAFGHPYRLGLYEGVPQTRRTSGYVFALPDRITLYRRSITRMAGDDPDALREAVRHVLVHEIAHHFGISDDRLRELGAY